MEGRVDLPGRPGAWVSTRMGQAWPCCWDWAPCPGDTLSNHLCLPLLSPVMVAVRDVVIPLALWASQEKEAVLFRPGESCEGGPVREGKEGVGARLSMPHHTPSPGSVQPPVVPA